MEIGQRVKHKLLGEGTIIYIMFEGTKRELFAVRFDEENPLLHNCMNLCEENHGFFLDENDLEKV